MAEPRDPPDPLDPRGLIRESYRIEGIGAAECRSILMDWALGTPEGADLPAMIAGLLERYGAREHPMTDLLREGLGKAGAGPRRRRRRAQRGRTPATE